ncbi:MAG: hypothetical protein V4674_00855 [Patescibacteria group bacterium]
MKGTLLKLFPAVLATLIAVPAAASASWLMLSTWNGLPGGHTDISGYGFAPNEQVTLNLEGSTRTVTADANGSFSGQPLDIPHVAVGQHVIHATAPSTSADANFYVDSYYGNTEPSSYYLLPGQTLSWRGGGFAPNETVTISGPDGASWSFTTDGGGSFGDQARMSAPYSYQNSSKTFHVTSSKSLYSRDYTIGFGSFYGNIEPSSYFVIKGQGMSATVRDFAPGEQVQVSINGTAATTVTADGGGNAGASFAAASSGESFTLEARGLSSGISSMRTVWLAQ